MMMMMTMMDNDDDDDNDDNETAGIAAVAIATNDDDNSKYENDIFHQYIVATLFPEKPQYDAEATENFNRMIYGELCNIPALPKSTVSIFLSSTFSGVLFQLFFFKGSQC